jgi:hypothetical protein
MLAEGRLKNSYAALYFNEIIALDYCLLYSNCLTT